MTQSVTFVAADGTDDVPINDSDAAWSGTWCGELELAAAGPVTGMLPAEPVHRLSRVLVRVHGEPLGYLFLEQQPGHLDADALRRQAAVEFATGLSDHLAADGIALPSIDSHSAGYVIAPADDRCRNRTMPQGLVSVIVCTRNRSDILRPCLDRLTALSYSDLEILIIDNAPSDTRTRELVAEIRSRDARFRYLCEPRPGLSVARNRGLVESRGRFIAYTDDDVAVDPGWIDGLLRGFTAGPSVGCVTGLVCTAGVGSPAEAYFDARSPSWSARIEPEQFDLGEHRRESSLFPYSAGIYGTGANFALRRELVEATGPFDESLGAGTLTRGGEDLDMFVRVLRAGFSIMYQPAALVWHHHRADDEALRSQLFGYGSGMAAYLVKYLLSSKTGPDILKRIPGGLLRMRHIRRDTARRMPTTVAAPRGAWTREGAGMVAGPLLYARARRRLRTNAPSTLLTKNEALMGDEA